MNIADYIKASYSELMNKVSWPTWQELVNSSVLVLVASLIFALIILVMDRFSDGLLDIIYSLLG